MILTPRDAAKRLSLSLTTVRRLLAAGVLPYVRLSPRRIGIPEAAKALTAKLERGPKKEWNAYDAALAKLEQLA